MKDKYLPEGWRLAEIGELVEEYTQRSGFEEYEVFSCSKIHGVILQKEKFKQRIASKETERYKLLHSGDFVYDPMLAWDGSIGRNHYTFSGIVSPAYVIFRPHQHMVDVDFLEAVLTSDGITPYYRTNSEGTNVRRRKLRFEVFSSIVIPLPPIDEQRRITEVLHDADANIAHVEAQVEAARTIKRGVTRRLLKYGLNGSTSHWNQATLGEICDNLDTKRVPISQDKRIPGPYPYYGASGITDWVNDYIFDETLILLAEDGKNLLYRNSPIAWRVDGKCWVNNHAHVFRAKQQADTDFVVHKLDSMPLNPYVTGSDLLKLTQEDALSIRLDLPPLGEQREIAAILSAHDATIRNLQMEAATLREVKCGLMQKLLSGQMRV